MTVIAPVVGTGVGSWPGTDFSQAVSAVFRLVPELPFWPELPQRGPAAGMIGRTTALLVDLPAELDGDSWRLTSHSGRDLQRARSLLAQDREEFTELAAAAQPGVLKIQVTGVWTLATELLLRNGRPVLTDAIAVRDLTDSLAAGIAAHIRDMTSSLPTTRFIVQVDEPSLPLVMGGNIRNGLSPIQTPERAVVLSRLETIVEAIHRSGSEAVVHCCAANPPFDVLQEAGFSAVMADVELLESSDTGEWDKLAAAIEAGLQFWPGVIPSSDTGEVITKPATIPSTVSRVQKMFARLGFDQLPTSSSQPEVPKLVITPTCGLAGATPHYATNALVHCGQTANALLDWVSKHNAQENGGSNG